MTAVNTVCIPKRGGSKTPQRQADEKSAPLNRRREWNKSRRISLRRQPQLRLADTDPGQKRREPAFAGHSPAAPFCIQRMTSIGAFKVQVSPAQIAIHQGTARCADEA